MDFRIDYMERLGRIGYRVIQSADLLHVAELARRDPDAVLFLNTRLPDSRPIPLSVLAKGPFCTVLENGTPVMKGFDISGKSAKLRIIDHMVEFVDDRNPIWRPLGRGGFKIFVPSKEIPFSGVMLQEIPKAVLR